MSGFYDIRNSHKKSFEAELTPVPAQLGSAQVRVQLLSISEVSNVLKSPLYPLETIALLRQVTIYRAYSNC